MAQTNKQNFLNLLVIVYVLIGVVLVITTLTSGVTDQGTTTGAGRPVITRAFNGEFLTLSAATRPPSTTAVATAIATEQKTITATPINTATTAPTRTPLATIED